jgi:hypothetical protein
VEDRKTLGGEQGETGLGGGGGLEDRARIQKGRLLRRSSCANNIITSSSYT